MECYSCKFIADMSLVVNGPIHLDKHPITLCCENMPGVPLSDNPAETFARFFELRSHLVAESFTGQEKTRTDVFCRNCINYKKDDWSFAPLVSFVNLSIYPSPCQARCCYCNIRNIDWYGHKSVMELPETKRAYEKLFELIAFGQQEGYILPDATYHVACGEITIHPYKKQIVELTRGKKTTYLTNAFLYDPDIGQELHSNSDARINVSIDAGIPETWHKVKGINNFDQIISNLVHYYQDSIQPGQITLKYIVLPGINDTLEDYCSIVEIMRVLEVGTLTISRNMAVRGAMNNKQRTELVSAAAYLMAMLRKNGLDFECVLYSQEEQNYAMQLMNEILEKDLI